MFAILLTEGMNPFYNNITSFPTVVFSFLLLLLVFYWLIAVLGFVSIDVLDFDLTEAGVDSDGGIDNANVLAGLMMKFGLNGVPVTIIISFISLFAWITSYYSVYLLFNFIPDGILEAFVGVPILIGSLYVAVLITSIVIKPLRPLFKSATQESFKYVVGQLAIVRTSRVDENFGEAMMADGGAGLILKVRSVKGTVFKKGDKVVLFEYIAEKNVYRVISEEDFSGI